MALLAANISADGTVEKRVLDRVAEACLAAESDRPVIAMIHGYRFSPTSPEHSPHRHIFSLSPKRSPRALSWPASLGADRPGGPLALAIGWEARGAFGGAYAQAEAAGLGLSRILRRVAQTRDRGSGGTRLLAHSLGARVALESLPHLPPGAVSGAVLLAPAETRAAANAALARAQAPPPILSVRSRENLFFDLLMERALAPIGFGARSLGRGPLRREADWIDLAIDDAPTLAALATLGHEIAPPAHLVCHWSVYLRARLFDFYRDILTGALPLPQLASALPDPATPSSALRALSVRLPLPFGAGQPS
ncbi:hypothetical protein RM543_07905 [Roseicyclus sp. F158]|uniref:Alpha/beta hydrolase n=1 Tax=Tropicimonas omnivorans TaxID=3075590 RepID=A0ABU3DFY6_9RHOB|nr:hypothetical protein [Roseicyclus sp. F158]MDT0682605.1 hypothetical protein [Roseicyclus sp. F158]